MSWNTNLVNETKRDIKAHLDAYTAEHGLDQRPREIFRCLDENLNESSSAGNLRAFVLGVSGIAYHARHGGLTPAQISKLAETCINVLEIQKIAPGTSNLSYLYGELYTALSQSSWRNGNDFRAAWEQQLALKLAGSSGVGTSGFPLLSTAMRYLRLGYASRASNYFEHAIKEGLEGGNHNLAYLGLLKSLRLCGNTSKFNDLYERHKLIEPTDYETQEWEWENLTFESSESGDITALLKTVSKNGSHATDSYTAEAYLWAWASSSKKYIAELPTVRHLVKTKFLHKQNLGYLVKCLQQFELCYDTNVSSTLRVDGLGRALDSLHRIRTVDKKLLILAAAARWLARHHYRELATLCLSEYESLSHRLSGGKVTDVLKVVEDLQAKDWFLKDK